MSQSTAQNTYRRFDGRASDNRALVVLLFWGGISANTSNAGQAASCDYTQNTMVWAADQDTDCPIFAPIVEGDHVKIWVTVQGSYSYDTQSGGSTNALMLEALQVELLPGTEY